MTDPIRDDEAERAVLCGLLMAPDALADLIPVLPPEAFADPRCRAVYRAMLRLWEKRVPPGVVTLSNELLVMGGRDPNAAREFVAGLMVDAAPGYHPRYYSDVVLQVARRRAIAEHGAALVRDAYAGEPDVAEAVTALREAVAPFAGGERTPESLADLMARVRERMVDRWEGRLVETVVPTGVRDLNRHLAGGVRGGELFVLAARPSMGKTSLALRMANASPSLVASLEMPAEAVAQRLAVMHAGVGYAVAASAFGDVAHRERVLEATEHLERHGRIVAVRDDLRTTGQIEAALERAMAEQGATTLFVDHLGLLADDCGPRASEYERVSRISWRLKELALRTGAAVIVLSQLNRAVEHRPECMPFLSDLRESGRVEENADHVALLYRRHYYVSKGMAQADPDKDWIGTWERVVVSLAKNRNGDTGAAELGWDGPAMRFVELDRRAA